jgi:hypothetical protein
VAVLVSNILGIRVGGRSLWLCCRWSTYFGARLGVIYPEVASLVDPTNGSGRDSSFPANSRIRTAGIYHRNKDSAGVDVQNPAFLTTGHLAPSDKKGAAVSSGPKYSLGFKGDGRRVPRLFVLSIPSKSANHRNMYKLLSVGGQRITSLVLLIPRTAIGRSCCTRSQNSGLVRAYRRSRLLLSRP